MLNQNIFESNSRTEQKKDGIYFYEQDILPCKYSLTGNAVLEFVLDYLTPGFGIVIAEDDGKSMKEAGDSYLFKVGGSDFRVYRYHALKQESIHVAANLLAPTSSQKDVKITVKINGKTVTMTWNTETGNYLLGEYTADKLPDFYKIGIYSNMGNIIRSIKIKQNVPNSWNVGIDNTAGGRISLGEDEITFENCANDAEIEQQDIHLEPGFYYLKYNSSEVNEKNDIEGFVFPSTINTENEDSFEDEKKNLLEDDCFILEEPTTVSLKFRGTNGKISDICICESLYESYIPTDDEEIVSNGSAIYIDLKDVSKVKWKAEVLGIPTSKLTEQIPYGIVWTAVKRWGLEELEIKTDKEYVFTYDVISGKLSIDNGIFKQIELTEEDGNKLCIMRNISAIIYELVVTKKDSSENDIMQEKTIKHYVPSIITSPIVVINKNTGESFDLSSSHREVVTQKEKIALYGWFGEIKVPGELPDTAFPIKVYGIPDGAIEDMSATSIEKFANKYVKLTSKEYSLNNGVVTIRDEQAKTKFKFIAIQYTDVSDYEYEFTNIEREVFDTNSRAIELTSLPSKENSTVYVYGIKKDSYTNDKYLYRVPAAGMETTIDLYAESYDIVQDYDIDYKNGVIKFKENHKDEYSEYVVDYLKKESYCINFSEEMQQYELDICSEDQEVDIVYDLHEDGSMYEYMTTNIKPDRSKYIVLKEGGKN